ncbi:hypothetical protein LZ023_35315 (plasmid) [Pseudomonas silvicola]|nr:hypothetical protein LZ023_35315 [Pseudomonas silvicola]
MGINRNTVALAYKRLTDAGFVLSRGRNGTVVREPIAEIDIEGSAPPGDTRSCQRQPCASALPRLISLSAHIQSTQLCMANRKYGLNLRRRVSNGYNPISMFPLN